MKSYIRLTSANVAFIACLHLPVCLRKKTGRQGGGYRAGICFKGGYRSFICH